MEEGQDSGGLVWTFVDSRGLKGGPERRVGEKTPPRQRESSLLTKVVLCLSAARFARRDNFQMSEQRSVWNTFFRRRYAAANSCQQHEQDRVVAKNTWLRVPSFSGAYAAEKFSKVVKTWTQAPSRGPAI